MELSRIWRAIATTGAMWIGGCGSAGPSHGEAIRGEAISAQGGFEDPERRLASADEDYCGAEVLRWRYDALAATLRLADARLMLNCCGQRSLQVERIDSIYEVTEKDAPDSAAGRCEHRCAFDFSVSVQDVPRSEVYVKLLRDVIDEQGGPVAIWSGLLDLTRGAGAIVLEGASSNASCQERTSPQRRTATFASR